VAAEFRVYGTFEVRDGRNVLWRDYFDWATFVLADVGGIGAALRRYVVQRAKVVRTVSGIVINTA
jgi:hypothetical protein